LYLQLAGGALTGSLGIGQALPYTQLHIRKDAGGQLGPSLTLMNSAGGAVAGGSIDFDGYDPGSGNPPAARIQSLDDGNYSAALTFQTKSPGGPASQNLVEQMRITDVGYVGIGTTSPNGRLTVTSQLAETAIVANGFNGNVFKDAGPAIEAYGGSGLAYYDGGPAGAGIIAQGGNGGTSDGPGGAFTVSGAKSDPSDTDSLLDLLLRHRERLHPLRPDTVETHLLHFLVEERRQTVDERTRANLRLTDCLKLYFPQVLRWFDDVASPLVGDLLERWPTLEELQRVHPGTLRRFFHEHNCRCEENAWRPSNKPAPPRKTRRCGRPAF
jgi:hypothetical protein